ncbi:hypothetical protein MBT84_24090 [Streptomyces sp. MBT84]|uniref:hypothetical protein n=1 Tax=Streptomyces sp. MBT84 TaxID=1488414 RepID=UPI001C6E7395|nr:hypothetical protein [Streptomyces sp. MBT84]MBW8702682.1 hypothetical protein [Streptomyces sp. MBT84]
MTQSGQGEEPSARPAREGIVLPSDGGEPLLPGQAGGANGSAVPAAGRHAAAAGGPEGHGAPAGGQAWGSPWGPEQSPQAPPAAQGWGGDAGQQWGAAGAAPAPEWGAHGAQSSWETPDPQQGWGRSPASQQPHGGAGQPLPPEGAQPSSYGQDGHLPQQGAYDHRQGAQPLPHAAPLPPADEGATQYIPPVALGPDEGATQYIPPVAAGADEGATQYIPPVTAGALPPEVSGDAATRFLGRAQGSAPLPPAGPDAQATQYLPPVPGQPGPAPYGMPEPQDDRRTPAEFDNLFRHAAGGAEPTQHLPRFDGADTPGAPMGRAAGRHDEGGGGRGRSRMPLIAAVGVGIVVLGIGAGALLGGGGGTDDEGGNSKNVSATGPAADSSPSGSDDAAKQQAVALDKLLADSGNSRGAVIKAVAEVKVCQNLGQAATDLRNAAQQRNGLVTQLSKLEVDKLPQHGELTNSLTAAWKASASADTHYAAWADQVAGNKKTCRKGHARSTGQTDAGNRDSGTASAQKAKAARLWNAIAQKYGLTQRQPTQL